MIRIFFSSSAFINIILLLKYADAEFNKTKPVVPLTKEMALFERFKENYNRVYPNQDLERKGYENFVGNLAVVNELNKEHPTNVVVYQLNRYADLDPDEIKEHYGIEIRPCKSYF